MNNCAKLHNDSYCWVYEGVRDESDKCEESHWKDCIAQSSTYCEMYDMTQAVIEANFGPLHPWEYAKIPDILNKGYEQGYVNSHGVYPEFVSDADWCNGVGYDILNINCDEVFDAYMAAYNRGLDDGGHIEEDFASENESGLTLASW